MIDSDRYKRKVKGKSKLEPRGVDGAPLLCLTACRQLPIQRAQLDSARALNSMNKRHDKTRHSTEKGGRWGELLCAHWACPASVSCAPDTDNHYNQVKSTKF